MNEQNYSKSTGPVKAVYTIRYNGKSYILRASHLEMLRILTILFGTQRQK